MTQGRKQGKKQRSKEPKKDVREEGRKEASGGGSKEGSRVHETKQGRKRALETKVDMTKIISKMVECVCFVSVCLFVSFSLWVSPLVSVFLSVRLFLFVSGSLSLLGVSLLVRSLVGASSCPTNYFFWSFRSFNSVFHGADVRLVQWCE